jgi:hypothetical protein
LQIVDDPAVDSLRVGGPRLCLLTDPVPFSACALDDADRLGFGISAELDGSCLMRSASACAVRAELAATWASRLAAPTSSTNRCVISAICDPACAKGSVSFASAIEEGAGRSPGPAVGVDG